VETLDRIFDHLMAAVSDDAILGLVAALDRTFDAALQAQLLGALLEALGDLQWGEGVADMMDMLLTEERVNLYVQTADEVRRAGLGRRRHDLALHVEERASQLLQRLESVDVGGRLRQGQAGHHLLPPPPHQDAEWRKPGFVPLHIETEAPASSINVRLARDSKLQNVPIESMHRSVLWTTGAEGCQLFTGTYTSSMLLWCVYAALPCNLK
jgi:hypothetical protein